MGSPITGVATRLRDDAGVPVPHDGEAIGRSQIAGPTLFDGYLNNPGKTAAEHTDDGWFITGDMAAVVGLPDPDLGQRIVAYIVGDLPDPGALSDFVATTLSAHKRPREIRTVDALPRNAMGKVQK